MKTTTEITIRNYQKIVFCLTRRRLSNLRGRLQSRRTSPMSLSINRVGLGKLIVTSLAFGLTSLAQFRNSESRCDDLQGNQMVKISPTLNTCDMSRPPLVWLLAFALKNRIAYFNAIIRVSQYRFEDSTRKKAAYHIMGAASFD